MTKSAQLLGERLREMVVAPERGLFFRRTGNLDRDSKHFGERRVQDRDELPGAGGNYVPLANHFLQGGKCRNPFLFVTAVPVQKTFKLFSIMEPRQLAVERIFRRQLAVGDYQSAR